VPPTTRATGTKGVPRKGGATRPHGSAAVAFLFALALAAPVLAGPEAAADGSIGDPSDAGAGPRYSLAADAAAGFAVSSPAYALADPGGSALWALSADLLHRIESTGWGATLHHSIDLSSRSGAVSSTVYEAFARLDLGDWGQLFVGKRRMGLGVGAAFSPADPVDPRTGFWDQKSGFRGLAVSASLGSELSLRACVSLERNLEAYQAALAAQGSFASPAQKAAALAALGGASGPADPALLGWAASIDYRGGIALLAASAAWSPGAYARPALGLSFDVGGFIAQAEAAVELEDGPSWHGTAGLRRTFSGADASLTLSIDYDYNGSPGLLSNTHYLLAYASLSAAWAFEAYVRALVGLEEPSALLSAGIVLLPATGFDLELAAALGLGEDGTEFAQRASAMRPPARWSAGLAARVHF
jgi:hypothetical protein